MKKIGLIGLLAVMVVCLGFAEAPVAQAQQVTTWKMQVAYPPGDGTWDIHSVEIKKIFEKAGKGKLKIDRYTPGALCDVKEMANAVSRGMIDMALIFGSAYAGTVPVADIDAGLPWAWGSQDQAAEIFWGAKYRLIDMMREGWAQKNVFYYVPLSCGRYLMLLNYPARTMADLKGHKIRASGAMGEWLKRAGGLPVLTPGAEIYMSIKLGAIEGTLYPPAALETLKLKEITKYLVYPGTGTVTPPQISVIINMKSWNALPADIRKALMDEKAQVKAYKAQGFSYMKLDEKSVESAVKNYGLQKIQWSDADDKQARKLAMDVWDKVAGKNATSKKAVDILKRYAEDKKLL